MHPSHHWVLVICKWSNRTKPDRKGYSSQQASPLAACLTTGNIQFSRGPILSVQSPQASLWQRIPSKVYPPGRQAEANLVSLIFPLLHYIISSPTAILPTSWGILAFFLRIAIPLPPTLGWPLPLGKSNSVSFLSTGFQKESSVKSPHQLCQRWR